jgi:hypothetical protein
MQSSSCLGFRVVQAAGMGSIHSDFNISMQVVNSFCTKLQVQFDSRPPAAPLWNPDASTCHFLPQVCRTISVRCRSALSLDLSHSHRLWSKNAQVILSKDGSPFSSFLCVVVKRYSYTECLLGSCLYEVLLSLHSLFRGFSLLYSQCTHASTFGELWRIRIGVEEL